MEYGRDGGSLDLQSLISPVAISAARMPPVFSAHYKTFSARLMKCKAFYKTSASLPIKSSEIFICPLE